MKAAAIILNFFVPGVGSLILGRVGTGIAQLLLYLVGLALTVTMIGAIIGLPLILGTWIWGLVTAATHNERSEVHVIHHGAPAGVLPGSPAAGLADDTLRTSTAAPVTARRG